jgi:UDP-N-acetylglucosamine--N-acetylmuramyl-(pentapeptide) pyrophosphoryl-undecaprenol N-acetylglucosamine transferase
MATQKNIGVVFTGGGSGGHIYPLLAVADALQKKTATLGATGEYFYLGPRDAYSPFFVNRGIAVRPIASGKMRRYFSLENIFDIPKFFIGLWQALWQMYRIMPDVVFSKGGTGALPVVLAAWFYRIPIAIHESDAQPGMTNLLSAHFANRIFVSFERAAQFFDPAKVVVSGAPIRSELLTNRQAKEAAKESLGFNPREALTLILGGSQGSVRVNDFIIENLAEILKTSQVIHQTGIANFDDVKKMSDAALAGQPAISAARYKPVNYLGDDMPTILAATDLVVMRPGGSVFEIAAFGIPAILIPLAESANDHQRLNAYEFAKNGAGVVIEEANLLPGIFLAQFKTILDDATLRAKMDAASAQFFVPGAAEKIADSLIAMA